MNNKENKVLTGCPYFQAEMKTCRLFNNGFFLPSKKDVSTYCLTSIYQKCPHYKRHSHVVNDAIATGEEEYGNRRRYKRIPVQRKSLVRSCDAEGNIIGDFSELALTVDCSQGGMRIVSSKKIPSDTLLIFNFDHDFLIPKFKGLAQLCWQRKSENFQDTIEAGLLFKETETQEALSLAIDTRVNLQ
jgi:hypothetical protein